MAGFDLADLYENYDPDSIDTSTRGERPAPMPDGDYLMQAIEAELTEKNGNVGLKLTFDVIEGEYEGRKVWEYMNIQHSNPTAQRLGQQAYTELWRDALRIKLPKSTEELLFKPLIGRVVTQPAKGEYAASNKIAKFLPAGGVSASVSRPAASRPAAPAASAGGSRPSFLKRA